MNPKGGTAGEVSGTAVTATSTDGILQFREISIDGDLVVLATPEIAGLPYTVAALVAAGGLAAALSTADGLLVVIAMAMNYINRRSTSLASATWAPACPV